MEFLKKLFKPIIDYRNKKRLEKLYKKRLEELKKRDPFIYKH